MLFSRAGLAVHRYCAAIIAIPTLLLFSPAVFGTTTRSEQLIQQQHRQRALEQQLLPLSLDVRLLLLVFPKGRLAYHTDAKPGITQT